MGLPAKLAPGETVPAPLPDDLQGYRGRTLYPDEEQELEGMSPKAQAYIRALALTGKAGLAAEMAGCSQVATVYWRAHHPQFVTLESGIKADIIARANDLAMDRVYEGFEERMYGAEGELKGKRVRQDPSHTARWLQSIDPAWRNDDKAQTINVQILQVTE